MDATLRELTGLIKEVNIESRVRGTTFDFVLISPDYSTPRFNAFEIGTTIAGNRSPDDSKTLGNTRYISNDHYLFKLIKPIVYIIITPNPKLLKPKIIVILLVGILIIFKF